MYGEVEWVMPSSLESVLHSLAFVTIESIPKASVSRTVRVSVDVKHFHSLPPISNISDSFFFLVRHMITHHLEVVNTFVQYLFIYYTLTAY